MDERRPVCPKCGDNVWRDSVDVGVGIIYGPYGCSHCGWSQDERYDKSSGVSPAQKEFPKHDVDQWGGLNPRLHLLLEPGEKGSDA